MVREHLFRGFHPDENGTTTITLDGKQIRGEWIEGNLFIPDDPSTSTQICMGTSTIRICYDVIPETVGEFTGLADKNCKKIFEWDIVKCTVIYDIGCYPNFKTEIREVKYCEGCFIPFYDCERNSFEVIGNIFENPELLEDRQ